MSVELSVLIPEFTKPDPVGETAARLMRMPDGAGVHASTAAWRCQAVEQVILAMRERLNEKLSLQEMAEIALFSPYHFNRVFRLITNITPCRFLTLLRMEAAKHLLLSTQLSVSDVCFGVGFRSLGSFTRDFTRFVGLSPRRLRRLATSSNESELDSLSEGAEVLRALPSDLEITGHVSGPEVFEGLIFVGFFSTPFPQGRPAGCALLTRPNTTYRIASVPDGRYYVFAAAFGHSEDALTCLAPDYDMLKVGSSDGPVLVREGEANRVPDVTLRPVRLTDPPILIAFPVLLADYLANTTDISLDPLR